jgi:succinate dehydrogenase hydrophobic anchor subunit
MVAGRFQMLGIPWRIWLSVAGVTSAMIGVHWDISWRRSIGRDTFRTPAHIAIQLCGAIAAIACGYLILRTTFSQSELRKESVGVLGFRGPLGAFICAGGGLTMVTSAPFDDRWHNAYGLDVKILSPPHVVPAVGMVAVEIGAMVLIAARMNRSEGRTRKYLEWLFLYVNSMILVALLVLVLEFTHRVFPHTAVCYRAICILTPIVLALASRATQVRWPATIVSGIYTAFLQGFLWILPLFPAQPKLGPVMQDVKQFIRAGFPLLILYATWAHGPFTAPDGSMC